MLRNEPPYELESSNQSSEFLHIPRWWHFCNCLSLPWINLYTSLTHNKTKQLTRRYAEDALFRVHLQLMLIRSLQDCSEDIGVPLPCSRFNQHVIYVHLHVNMHHVMKDGHHGPLI